MVFPEKFPLCLLLCFVSGTWLPGQAPPASGGASGTPKAAKRNSNAAKPGATGKPRPVEDPDLAKFGIYQQSGPEASRTEARETTLPLELKRGDRIAFLGNTLLDRAQDFGHFEALIHLSHPEHDLAIRTLAWSADEVGLQPRPDNFATLRQHLARERTDVIFAAFGFNESFAGAEVAASFKHRLRAWIADMKTSAFNGSSGPRIVLLSPIANENIPGIAAADQNNSRIAAYVKGMQEVAEEERIAFVNLFEATRGDLDEPDSVLTINGAHLTEQGYARMSGQLFRGVFGKSPPAMNEELRAAVVDKNRQYFRRYRPLNSFYYTGGRRKDYGYLDFLPAMRSYDIMVANRERRIWDLARGKSFAGHPVDDSNVPPMEEVAESRGANEWLAAEDELRAFRVDPRFEVNLFASEAQFPEIANPIQMRWDARGRLWLSCSTTYPHAYPGREPNDKMVILEDTDQDGRADKSTVWADDLHIPLSFELIKDGILVSEQPHLCRILDTDGDGRADRRDKLLTGFGTEDSHHSLHDFVWTPDGDLLFRESIFHNSQVETAWGPVRAKNSAWFQFTLSTQRLVAFGSYPNTNPWGVTFDDWGNHVASHPIFANAFHAANPPYPQQHPGAGKLPAYSGVCGHEFVDFPQWPKEMQGGFIKVRYKPTNKVEIHQWIEKEDHFEEKYVSDLIFSENLSFIPVDVGFGPRGDLFVCDWYDPVKGHAQYSLRDPRRDRKSGRIWRIVPKGAQLQDPPPLSGASIPVLLENLKRREYRYRYWTKRELRERDGSAVAAALDAWTAGLDRKAERFRHHQTEAMWTYRGCGTARPELLAELLACEEHHARAAAARMLRHWHGEFADGGAALLAVAAADSSALVRLEAVISASHAGTAGALQAVLRAMKLPADAHLRYATACALGSARLRRHWEKDAALAPAVAAFVKGAAAADRVVVNRQPQTAAEKAFDQQRDLAVVEISAVPERLLFAPAEFAVKPGQPVKLVFSNPDLMQHNLLIIQPGALEEIGMAGNEMAKDPDGLKKGFIPESGKILHATKLLNPQTGEVLRFKAPDKPGAYPFVCTFPGHWVIMNGKMVVKP